MWQRQASVQEILDGRTWEAQGHTSTILLRPGRAGQRPGGRPTARRPFPADRAALGPSGGRAARRRVHHVLVARRTQLEARLLVRVLGLVVGLLLRNAHAPHPLLPFLP
ncbi:unnamed protein product, partial [Prorocentrum cordatum]